MKSKKLIVLALLAMLLLMFSAFSLDINTGDRITVFNNDVIPAGDIVTGDAVTVFGNLEIKGAVSGDVVAVFGNVDLYGEAKGDIVAVFGNVNVHKDAIVGGDAVGVLGSVNKEQGAVIRGDVADTKAGFMPKGFDLMPNMSFGSVIGMIIMYGLSCLAVMIMPDKIAYMARSSQHNIGRHLGIGFLFMLVLVLLIPVLIITIIGIIPAFLLIIAFAIVALISNTAVYIALGQKIAAAVESKNAVYIHLLIGLVVVNALVIVPVLGALASIVVFFVGLGVAFDTKVGGLLMRKKAL